MTQDEAMISERLVRVETKLDLLISNIEPRHRATEDRAQEHDGRLRAVEQAVAEVRTRVALMAGGTGGASGVVTALIAHYLSR